MWRLLAFILLCVFFLVFIVFNLENKSDVSFGFRTFGEIPVFLTALSSFVLGMLFAVPFVLAFGKRRKKSSQAQPNPVASLEPGGPSDSVVSSDPADLLPESPSSTEKSRTFGLKKWWGSKNKKGPSDTATPMNEVKKEKSPYGVD